MAIEPPTLHQDVAECAHTKHLCRYKEILTRIGFPCPGVVFDYLVRGIQQFGPLPSFGLFPKRFKPASATTAAFL